MDSHLNLKLQEYEVVVSLYDTVLNVGYQRFLSYFAVHAALFVGFFTANQAMEKSLLSVAGVAFAILTILTMEHFRQLFLLRASQALRVESEINRLVKSDCLNLFRESRLFLTSRQSVVICDANDNEVIKLPSGPLGYLVRGRGAVIVEQFASWLILIMWVVTLLSSLNA